jgi:hypothetical protein
VQAHGVYHITARPSVLEWQTHADALMRLLGTHAPPRRGVAHRARDRPLARRAAEYPLQTRRVAWAVGDGATLDDHPLSIRSAAVHPAQRLGEHRRISRWNCSPLSITVTAASCWRLTSSRRPCARYVCLRWLRRLPKPSDSPVAQRFARSSARVFEALDADALVGLVRLAVALERRADRHEVRHRAGVCASAIVVGCDS